MRTFAIATILIAILVGFTAGGQRRSATSDEAREARPVQSRQPPSPGTVQIERAANGHFMVEVRPTVTSLTSSSILAPARSR